MKTILADKKKAIVILVLIIFCTGMTMGCVCAGHTYHKKGYTFTVSDNQYKKIQYVKKHKYDSPNKMKNHKVWFKVKTGKYKTVKVGSKKVKKPIYASIETHKGDYYYVTDDFYVNGYGYVKWGGLL